MGLLRLLLALSVVAGHSGGIRGFLLVDAGLAVKVFFIVSGFYMTLILSKKYADLWLFYSNRALRLWPTYLVVLAASLALYVLVWIYTGHRPPPEWKVDAYGAMPWWLFFFFGFGNVTMIGLDIMTLFHYLPSVGFRIWHFTRTLQAPDGAHWAGNLIVVPQAWTISSEIWFYMLVPLLVRRSTLFLAVLAAASCGLAWWMESWTGLGYYFFPSLLYFFVLGILLYRLYDAWRSYFERSPLGIAFYCAIPLCFVLMEWLPRAAEAPLVLAFSVVAIPFLFGRFKDQAWDTQLGNLSYPLYLAHALVIDALIVGFRVREGAAVAAVSIVIALGLYLLVDRPIDILRQRRLAAASAKRSQQDAGSRARDRSPATRSVVIKPP
jgi:peptidoglycan/LPS O-acetylase OafA/YrhL